MITLRINGEQVTVEDVDPETPLLWILRDRLGLTGTKFGCGFNQCGACTVHVDGVAARSCFTTLAEASGKDVTTIEGLSEDGDHPVQQAWAECDVPQCGYCQTGQIMAAVALLMRNQNPSDQDIEAAMRRNICRCGTYQRIRKAIHMAAEAMR